MAITVNSSKVSTALGAVETFRLTAPNGAYVELSSLGAAITKVAVPDRHGKLANIALGYPDTSSYISDGPCAGKTIGRFAGRIAGARIEIDGIESRLEANEGTTCLHGGHDLHNRVWEAEIIPGGIKFSCLSPDGCKGFPGNFRVEAAYTWDYSDDVNVLSVKYTATTDAPTAINITNHAYWNLRADFTPESLYEHRLTMPAPSFVEIDADHLNTGRVLPVDGTPMDFRSGASLAHTASTSFEPIAMERGYNHCFILDHAGKADALPRCAVLSDIVSGRSLTVSSNAPALQLYTGNWLNGSAEAHHGVPADHCAVALELQSPTEPVSVLRPGETYFRQIDFEFTLLP